MRRGKEGTRAVFAAMIYGYNILIIIIDMYIIRKILLGWT